MSTTHALSNALNSRRLSQIDEGINQVRTNSPILVTTNGMLLLTPWPTSLLILTPLTQPIINMFWHISLIEQVTQLPLTQFAQVLDHQKLYTQLTRKFHHSSRLAVEYGRTGSSEQSYLATTSLMSVSQYSASICTHIWPTFDSHNHLLSFTPHRWKLSSQNWSITPNVHQVINTITCTLSQMKVTVQWGNHTMSGYKLVDNVS